MSEDEVEEWQEESPVEFARNLYQQVLYETRQTLAGETKQKEERSGIDNTYQQFGAKHDGFDEMWKAGELTIFMNANPGHNAISAYHELNAQKTIDEAVKTAVAEKETEMLKNFKAKKTATVIGGGPAQGPGPSIDPALLNTRAKGGLVSAITSRLMASRGT